MQFVVFTKPDLLADAAPQSSAPAANRIWRVAQNFDSNNTHPVESLAVALQGLTAGLADVADLAATGQLYVKDASGIWVESGPTQALTNLRLAYFRIPGTRDVDDVFVRLTAISGTGLATLKIAYSPSGPPTAADIPALAAALPVGAATAANQVLEIAKLTTIDSRDALEITESPIATLAYTKATTTDDTAPTDATAVQATLTQSARPSTSIVAFVQLVDGGGVAVAGANCSVRAWLRVTLPGGATYTYIDLGRRDGVYGNKMVTWAFGAIRGSIELFFQVTNVQGAPTTIKVYAMPGADIPGAYDPATGAIRSMDILVRGGEQNAVGAHMTAVRVTQSPDGAAAWDEPTAAALEASSVTKAGPGCLYGFIATNTNAAVRYLQFYDAVAVPADGAIPKLNFALQPGVTMVIQIPPERRYFATGICWAVSTAIIDKRIAAAETWASVAYA